jgi:hypothetical protein
VYCTEAEAELVREFTDHNEYGLALETVYDDLVEEPRTITDETIQAVRQLASRMNLQSRSWYELEVLPDLLAQRVVVAYQLTDPPATRVQATPRAGSVRHSRGRYPPARGHG